MLAVKTLMRGAPVTVTPQASLRAVVALMNRDGCRHVPVVENGLLVGIISDRDVRLAINSPVLEEDAGLDRADVLESLTVESCMTPKPQTVGPDDPIHEVADRMRLYKRDAMPVVEDGCLVGIVTTSDFLSYVATQGAPVEV